MMRRILLLITALIAGCTSISARPLSPSSQVISFHSPSPLHTAQTAEWFDSIVRIEDVENQGTGFVVGIDEQWVYIMTVRHLFKNGLPFLVDNQPAVIHAIALNYDLAIVRVENVNRYTKVYTFSSPFLDIEVWAIGYSRWRGKTVRLVHRGRIVSLDFVDSQGNWTVTHNAGGRGGMSGGPLLNVDGNVLGICSFFTDMGFDEWTTNVSELCAVPSISAAIFWQKVKEDKMMKRED